MSERDELAQVVHEALSVETGIHDTSEEEDRAIADHILAYLSRKSRKPREVTTAAELNALAYGAVLLTSDYTDTALLKDRDVFRNQSGGEVTAEMLISYGTQPFTVLHEPTP